MQSERKKQFLSLLGKPILERTIERFVSFELFARIIVVLPLDEFDVAKKRLGRLYPALEFVKGGKMRQDSIANALNFVENTDFVFVHDGVRPFASKNVVQKLAEKVQSVQAVIPVVPTTNTLKQVSSGVIEKSLNRQKIFGATTPQAFSFSLLNSAYQKAKNSQLEFTDDASILESQGAAVHCVEDEPVNIKITTPFDFLVAEAICQKNGEAES